jgi:hypothetical protein
MESTNCKYLRYVFVFMSYQAYFLFLMFKYSPDFFVLRHPSICILPLVCEKVRSDAMELVSLAEGTKIFIYL